MKKLITGNLAGRHSGFGLMEMIIVVGIAGILGAGVITAIFQIGNVNSIDNARMVAVKQVENSIHYINRDVQMAQKVEANGETYWLRLTWTTWSNGDINQVVYALADSELTRSYSINGVVSQTSVVGRFISDASATAPNLQATPPEKAWTFQLTSSAVSGLKQAAEVREFKIVPRPGS